MITNHLSTPRQGPPFRLALCLAVILIAGCDAGNSDSDRTRSDSEPGHGASASHPVQLTSGPPTWRGAESWGADPLWDDGLAEVAIYDARRARYGKKRRFIAHLITVKEDFNTAYQAKADAPFDGKTILPILKVNRVETMPTDDYDYHLMTSVFVLRERVDHPHKLTLAMHEWCGNTFIEYMGWAAEPRLHFHSYFDDQGDGDWRLGLGSGLLDEQLPLSLRSLPFAEGFEVEVDLLDPLVLRSLDRPPAVQRTTLRVEKREKTEQIDCWRVLVDRPDGPDATLWFEVEPPNILVKLEAEDGRRLRLRERTRRTYW